MSRHHPSETTLLAHAAGSLPAPHRQVVAVHLATCPDCAADLRALEAAAGTLVQNLPPVDMAKNALARLMARLDEPNPPAPAPVSATPFTLAALATGRWHWSGPGIALMPLMLRDSSNTRLDLIRVAPGTALLEHGHTSLETTVVLQGAFDDGLDRYEVGDFGEATGDTDHCPRALPGPDCICLIATSAHLKAHSLLGRIVRPLLGM
jgi:putative transcriptional regulator